MNWLVCIHNTGYEASLEARKLYQMQDDPKAETLDMVRVVDESGESYLYPAYFFAPIAIQQPLEQQLLAA